MELNLRGKVALITGGGQGIGRAIALAFANEGARVAVADKNPATAADVADEINQFGGEAISIQADVTDEAQVRAMVDKVLTEFGQIDILVNNAGTAFHKFFAQSTRKDWDIDINVNLLGAMNCASAVVQHMIDRRYGKIVSIASDAGKIGEARLVTYSAAKAGIIAFSKALAKELGRYGINVNSVSPGTIETPLAMGLLGDNVDQVVKSYAIRRLGKPEDIANAVVFLASDAASFITGQSLSVNGGYSMA
ncbi:MAG: 3-oxoacyl-ACP reductase FabG [Chloroflexi bacterium]|nr:3-oxoacyl-ACP reductase FabG [Chloroflexota bacterium]MDA8186978.1 3-oxoacyl-ACP reductase FabG [Dehalococcoidales bacterium]